MMQHESIEAKKPVTLSRGRLYFSRAQERRFYWYATVAMGALGLLYHWGVL